MRAEGAFDGQTIHFFRASPALRSAQNDHGPAWSRISWSVYRSRFFLDFSYAAVAAIQSAREKLVHDFRVVAFNEIGGVAKTFIQGDKFFVAGARLDCGAGDFVTVQVQDGEHGPISRRIQKLDALPTSFERASLSFAIADDASHDQIRIVERRSQSVDQRIAQFSAFMHGVRRMRPTMARNSSGR